MREVRQVLQRPIIVVAEMKRSRESSIGSESEEGSSSGTLSTNSEHSEESLERRHEHNSRRQRHEPVAERHAPDAERHEVNSYTVWGRDGPKEFSFDAPLPIKKPSYQGGNVKQAPFSKTVSDQVIRLNEDYQGGDDAREHLTTLRDELEDLIERIGIDPEEFMRNPQGMEQPWIEAVLGGVTWSQFCQADAKMRTRFIEQMDAHSYETYNDFRSLLYQARKCVERDPHVSAEANELINQIESMYGFFYRMVSSFYDRVCSLQLLLDRGESVFVARIPYDMYEDVAPPPTDEDDAARARVNELLLVKDRIRSLCKKCMLRRWEKQIMKPVYRDGKFAWAYVPLEDIEPWLIQKASHEFGRIVYEAFEGKKGNANDIKAYFMERGGIPDLQTTRYMISFRNGVYFIEHDRFVLHKDMTQDYLPAPNVYSCTFIDENFEHYPLLRNVHLPFPHNGDAPPVANTAYDIPTPYFDKIMNDQHWPYEVRIAMYVMFGRLLFDQDYLDAEQQAIFCYGRRSVGKSTFCKIINFIYPHHLIGSCATDQQKTFGMEAFLKKYIIVQSEVRNNWGMEPSDFLKMIAGDVVKLQRKFKTAIDVVWRALMIMAGNEVMGWNDDHAAIARRLCIFAFNHAIEVDMGLDSKLKSEVPRIICKCVRFYLARVHYFPRSKIPWPVYFEQSRERFLRATSPIFAFLRSKELIADKNFYVPFSAVINAYRTYCRTTGVKRKLNTEMETWRVAFEDVGMRLTENEEMRVYPPESNAEPRRDFYLDGYDLATRHMFGQQQQDFIQ